MSSGNNSPPSSTEATSLCGLRKVLAQLPNLHTFELELAAPAPGRVVPSDARPAALEKAARLVTEAVRVLTDAFLAGEVPGEPVTVNRSAARAFASMAALAARRAVRGAASRSQGRTVRAEPALS